MRARYCVSCPAPISSSRQRGPCVADEARLARAAAHRRRRARQAHLGRRQIELAAHALARREQRQQLGDARARGHRLEHQFHRAAAGQAEALRLLGADAVAHDLGTPLERQRALAHLLDQVVLDAAAGDGAGDDAVAAHRDHRADRPRRRAPGAHHGAEHRALPRFEPGRDLAQHIQIDVVHVVLSVVSPSGAVPPRA